MMRTTSHADLYWAPSSAEVLPTQFETARVRILLLTTSRRLLMPETVQQCTPSGKGVRTCAHRLASRRRTRF